MKLAVVLSVRTAATVCLSPPCSPSHTGRLSLARSMFADPPAAFAAFDFCLPGDSGSRNILRGDGYFEQDAGPAKTFPHQRTISR